jgi:hypothetical protein
MSSELKTMLNKVAVEDSKLEETEFEEGINHYKAILLKVAKEKKLDIIISFEGTQQRDLNKNERVLDVLERALLVKGETKYTHRNVYRQYELTTKGAELVEKLSKENMSDKEPHHPHTLGAP